jgi:hypothetical protein
MCESFGTMFYYEEVASNIYFLLDYHYFFLQWKLGKRELLWSERLVIYGMINSFGCSTYFSIIEDFISVNNITY